MKLFSNQLSISTCLLLSGKKVVIHPQHRKRIQGASSSGAGSEAGQVEKDQFTRPVRDRRESAIHMPRHAVKRNGKLPVRPGMNLHFYGVESF